MCLIALAYRVHPHYELVLAANRDEFHARAADAAAYWADSADVYGGRDRSQGGGWLALSLRRRLAAVTNVRRMVPPDPAAPSRGKLVSDFVRGAESAAAFAEGLRAQAARYAGFNLLLWDGSELRYLSNQDGFRTEALVPGIHGVSNAALDTPWPKLQRVKQGVAAWCASPRSDSAGLLDLLGDDLPAADTELPDTGVGLEMERFLSPPFIRGERYGTRASTVVLAARATARFSERRFGPNGARIGESSELLALRP